MMTNRKKDLFRSSPTPPTYESDESNDISDAEFTEMKEQMYQDKLANLKCQLTKLNDESLPEYQKKLQRLDKIHEERLRFNEIIKDLEVEMVEKEFILEKKSALRELEDQKICLKDQLIAELEEKKKLIEAERHKMELTGDSIEMKPIAIRKLRRHVNEPSGTGSAKRRKPMQLSSLTYLLEDSEVIDDLKIINKNKAFSVRTLIFWFHS